jgi:hypothetical protein
MLAALVALLILFVWQWVEGFSLGLLPPVVCDSVASAGGRDAL